MNMQPPPIRYVCAVVQDARADRHADGTIRVRMQVRDAIPGPYMPVGALVARAARRQRARQTHPRKRR